MSKIIVALDGKGYSESLEIAESLVGHVWGFKINDLAAFYGAHMITDLSQFGNVMLDLKWHDIPNTIKNIAVRFTTHKFQICTVHASGGIPMMRAAVKELGNRVAAVTVLTSMDDHDCVRLFKRGSRKVVPELAVSALAAGCAYVVCSGLELQNMKQFNIKKIVPGIRPVWYQEKDDQMRVMTPAEAVGQGADLLVMGRPILKGNPVENAKRTNEEIGDYDYLFTP